MYTEYSKRLYSKCLYVFCTTGMHFPENLNPIICNLLMYYVQPQQGLLGQSKHYIRCKKAQSRLIAEFMNNSIVHFFQSALGNQ